MPPGKRRGEHPGRPSGARHAPRSRAAAGRTDTPPGGRREAGRGGSCGRHVRGNPRASGAADLTGPGTKTGSQAWAERRPARAPRSRQSGGGSAGGSRGQAGSSAPARRQAPRAAHLARRRRWSARLWPCRPPTSAASPDPRWPWLRRRPPGSWLSLSPTPPRTSPRPAPRRRPAPALVRSLLPAAGRETGVGGPSVSLPGGGGGAASPRPRVLASRGPHCWAVCGLGRGALAFWFLRRWT